MHILVLNPGSSSIKFSMHEVGEGSRAAGAGAAELRTLYEGELGGIGGPAGEAGVSRCGGERPERQAGRGETRLDAGGDCGGGARGGAGWAAAAGRGWVSRGASGGASARTSAADGGGAGGVARGVRVRSAARSRGAGDDRGDDAAVRGCAAHCLLRHGLPRDDAGGGDGICAALRGAATGRAAVWISWAVVRVGGGATEGGAGDRVSAAVGDRAPGQRMQRDGVHRRQVGGHDDGADADRRRDDGDADRAIWIPAWFSS